MYIYHIWHKWSLAWECVSCVLLVYSEHGYSRQNPWLQIDIQLHQFIVWKYVVAWTHWSQVTHIRVGKLSIIGSDNGLSPDLRQAIIWTNAGILLIWPYGTNFSEILIKILTFSFTKMSLKVLSGKWRPFCLSLNVLINWMAWYYLLQSTRHFDMNAIYSYFCTATSVNIWCDF